MRILSVTIRNFRGIAEGTVVLPKHGLLVGPNNVGKSTVLEALDLALGPDRVSGPDAIDEHDFHANCYRRNLVKKEVGEPGAGGNASAASSRNDRAALPGVDDSISIEVVLGEMNEPELKKFRGNVEPWNTAEDRAKTADELTTASPLTDYVLRVRFRGWYDAAEDEFASTTEFLHPQQPDGTYSSFGRSHKRAIGFLYLRSLRTARRAASMQRGSLLDVLLGLADARPRFWEEVIGGLEKLGESVSKDPGLRTILDGLDQALGAYLPRHQSGATEVSRLNVTQLTRAHLHSEMTLFLSSFESGHILPFDHVGSGMTNLLVLALLSQIAERKANVIFAMEEPEIAVGPTVQRRIIARLTGGLAHQALMTSHSPYVAEQMLPDHIVVLRRSNDGKLTSSIASAAGSLKERILRKDFRTRFAEGLLGRSVLVVEGLTEVYALPAGSNVLAAVPKTAYLGLDVMGVVPVDGMGNGNFVAVAQFFSKAGIDTYVLSDKLDSAAVAAIKASARDVHAHSYSGFEYILSKELALDVLKRCATALSARSDYCRDVKLPSNSAPEDEWRDTLYQILKNRKGEGYAALVLLGCAASELPVSLRRYLGRLHTLVTGRALPDTDPLYSLLGT